MNLKALLIDKAMLDRWKVSVCICTLLSLNSPLALFEVFCNILMKQTGPIHPIRCAKSKMAVTGEVNAP